MSRPRLLLSFSGGLDTSYGVVNLSDRYDVSTVTFDCGGLDDAERERRRTVGQLGLAVTGAAAGGLLLFRAGPAARASLFLPLALSLGYLESANTGL